MDWLDVTVVTRASSILKLDVSGRSGVARIVAIKVRRQERVGGGVWASRTTYVVDATSVAVRQVIGRIRLSKNSIAGQPLLWVRTTSWSRAKPQGGHRKTAESFKCRGITMGSAWEVAKRIVTGNVKEMYSFPPRSSRSRRPSCRGFQISFPVGDVLLVMSVYPLRN